MEGYAYLYCGVQSQLNLGLPADGALGPARRWIEGLTPAQRALIMSALSRDAAAVSLVDFAVNHAGEGHDDVNPFALMGGGGGGGDSRGRTQHELLAVAVLDLCRSVAEPSERVMAGLEAVHTALLADAAAAAEARVMRESAIEARNTVAAAAETLSQLSQFSQGSIRSFAMGGDDDE